jgi:hypothetical protein
MDYRDHLLGKRAQLEREHRQAVSPILNHLARTQGMMLPTILVSPKGVEYRYSADQQQVLDSYQALLDQVANSFRPQIEEIDRMLGLLATH